MPKLSNIGELTNIAKDIEAVFNKYYEGKPAFAIAFNLPPDRHEVHWVTNVDRMDGIFIMRETADKMQSQIN